MRSIGIPALCCILGVCVIVQGLYQVEVRLLGYENPTQRCQGCRLSNNLRSCCDDFSRQDRCTDDDRECDSYFIYCLRPFGTSNTREGGCSNFSKLISGINTDDGRIDFSQIEVLGLDNPLHLRGLTDGYTDGIQLFIEIQDKDIGNNNRWGAREPDELVDILVIDYNQAVKTSHRQNYKGMYGFVTMDLNITVFCVENFAEPDCSRCVPGFTGPDCQTNINDCLSNPCAPNGECIDGVDSFICNCYPGFTGELCHPNVNDCEGVNCNIEGRIFGGVVGAVLVIILPVVVLVVVAGLIWRHRIRQRKTNNSEGPGTKQGSGHHDLQPSHQTSSTRELDSSIIYSRDENYYESPDF